LMDVAVCKQGSPSVTVHMMTLCIRTLQKIIHKLTSLSNTLNGIIWLFMVCISIWTQLTRGDSSLARKCLYLMVSLSYSPIIWNKSPSKTILLIRTSNLKTGKGAI
jgi:hypothetical protein